MFKRKKDAEKKWMWRRRIEPVYHFLLGIAENQNLDHNES